MQEEAVRPDGETIGLRFFRTLGREKKAFFGEVIRDIDGEKWLWFSDSEWAIAAGRECIFLFEDALPPSGYFIN